MVRRSNLDNPEYAAFAWARYWRVLRWMAAVTGFCVVAALAFLYWRNGYVSIHMFIAAAGAVGVSMLLAAALMGLVFLSSGSGHDEAVEDPLEDELRDDE